MFDDTTQSVDQSHSNQGQSGSIRKNLPMTLRILFGVMIAIGFWLLLFVSPFSEFLNNVENTYSGSFTVLNTLLSGVFVVLLLFWYEQSVLRRRRREKEVNNFVANVKVEADENRRILKSLRESDLRERLLKTLGVKFVELGGEDWQMLTDVLYWLATGLSYRMWSVLKESVSGTELRDIEEQYRKGRYRNRDVSLDDIFKDVTHIRDLAKTCSARLTLYLQCSRDVAVLDSLSDSAEAVKYVDRAGGLVKYALAPDEDLEDLRSRWDKVEGYSPF